MRSGTARQGLQNRSAAVPRRLRTSRLTLRQQARLFNVALVEVVPARRCVRDSKKGSRRRRYSRRFSSFIAKCGECGECVEPVSGPNLPDSQSTVSPTTAPPTPPMAAPTGPPTAAPPAAPMAAPVTVPQAPSITTAESTTKMRNPRRIQPSFVALKQRHRSADVPRARPTPVEAHHAVRPAGCVISSGI